MLGFKLKMFIFKIINNNNPLNRTTNLSIFIVSIKNTMEMMEERYVHVSLNRFHGGIPGGGRKTPVSVRTGERWNQNFY